MLGISKKCSPRLDWINELQPNKSFTKENDSRSPQPHLECFYVKYTYSFPSSKRDRFHIHFCSPSSPESWSFCPFYFSIWRVRVCNVCHTVFLSCEQVKGYWPMTPFVYSCRLYHSRAFLSCCTFQLLFFTGKSNSICNINI